MERLIKSAIMCPAFSLKISIKTDRDLGLLAKICFAEIRCRVRETGGEEGIGAGRRMGGGRGRSAFRNLAADE